MNSQTGEDSFDIAEQDFDRAVLEASRERPVVVDFWAPWCGPCRVLGPLLERLVAERKGEILLAKVNIDEAQELAGRYYVDAIPAVKAFRDGAPVLEFVGLLPEAQLRQFLDKIAPTEADRLVKQARQLEDTNRDEAAALYRRALGLQRGHEAALLGLVRVLIAQGKDDEAAELLAGAAFDGERQTEAEKLEAVLFLRRRAKELGDEATIRQHYAASPQDAQAQYELGCVLGAAGHYPEALERLLAAAEADPKLAAARIREVMVKIFSLVGVRSALADDYREELSRLLY